MSEEIERIGDYEIRIFEAAQTDSADEPLFWMELFDHDKQSSVDSCSCHAIEEAVATFDSFVAQAEDPGTPPPNQRDEPQD